MTKLEKEIRKRLGYLIKKMPWSYQDRILYYKTFNKLPNIRDPRLFTEKILYRKIVEGEYVRYSNLSDKILVRDYITSEIGSKYLIPLVHQTDNPSTLLNLPTLENTVIKPNHGSGMVEILLKEPDGYQKNILIERCYQWLKHDFSHQSREIHYRYIYPRILVEKYIGDGGFGAVDYKFHMFNKKNGNFEYVLQVIYNRKDSAALSMLFYVNNLKTCFHKIRDTGMDISNDQLLIAQAMELSKVLARNFDYVRVDWYIHQNRHLLW